LEVNTCKKNKQGDIFADEQVQPTVQNNICTSIGEDRYVAEQAATGADRYGATQAPAYQYLEIEAADVGTKWGTSVVTSLLGAPAVDKCQFIARAWDEEERWVEATANFTKFAGVSFDEMKEVSYQRYEEVQQQLARTLPRAGEVSQR
jgi:hypothetical protein